MQSFVDEEVSVNITVFLGAPGSGKGTQAKILSSDGKYIHLSTGDILRNAIKTQTPLGKEAKVFMDKGELVPDATVISLIEDTLKTLSPDAQIILDGFPRTVPQAEALDAKGTTKVKSAIFFDIPNSALIERLTGRRVCRNCGQPYHVKHMPPKKAGVCDVCSGEVYQRSDDTEEVVVRRLEVFGSQNQGLLDYYSRLNKLWNLSADRSPQEIQKSLIEVLK
ncbi:MAG: nucleoside monophosphate kinase [Proteobacteria bacterium]|nr:nucleoside monophosphate kinase [Pseudomonadota bacterium]NDC24031.1 nucleoside monophosphate kinase [Pseudomonadota bacterium]NDD04039.1 nucleoside monophosphate kinase [Pseudomonadota bacterium]NDG26558.1 nucleoside monophosphate kinase [Pseudomonadota bacterium]